MSDHDLRFWSTDARNRGAERWYRGHGPTARPSPALVAAPEYQAMARGGQHADAGPRADAGPTRGVADRGGQCGLRSRRRSDASGPVSPSRASECRRDRQRQRGRCPDDGAAGDEGSPR